MFAHFKKVTRKCNHHQAAHIQGFQIKSAIQSKEKQVNLNRQKNQGVKKE
jgi:hypothetical protein